MSNETDDFSLKIIDKTADWHPKFSKPKEPRINWRDPATREMIVQVTQDSGMVHPPLRTSLYILDGLYPDVWKKSSYSSLCGHVSKWRDYGLIPYGIWSDEGCGAKYIPNTPAFIEKQIRAWKETEPWVMPSDGVMKCIYIEHMGLVDTFTNWMDEKVPIISSQGQIRHEFVYSTLTRLEQIIDELGGHSITLYVLVDYDKGGRHIYNSLEKWFTLPVPSSRFPNIKVIKYALSREQVLAAGMPDRPTQLDEWMPLYGISKLQSELRKLCGLEK